MDSVSIRAAITKDLNLSSLNNRYLVLIVPEAGKFKTKIPATSVPIASSLSFLQLVTVLLCLYMAVSSLFL